MRWLLGKLVLAATVTLFAGQRPAEACSFCCAVSYTFAEELEQYDIVAIGKLVAVTSGAGGPASATFEIVDLLKGKGLAKKLPDRVQVPGFTAVGANNRYLLLGVGSQSLIWSPPYPASARLAPYLREVLRLPKQGPQRLEFFTRRLEDADEMIARDAWEELSRADYADLKRLRPVLRHDQLVAWINDGETPASRRRLYLTLLGVCGSARDVPMLERLIRSERREEKRGQESLIACYLTHRRAAGLALANELYLANRAADYVETYAAIMAIRFHLKDESVIAKDHLVASLRLLLERPDLADLVIDDLAKAKDWSVIDRLMILFRDSDPKESWVRIPVINYLRACPMPRAKDYLSECETIDPTAFQRAIEKFAIKAPTN
jgi:hypothetical protein